MISVRAQAGMSVNTQTGRIMDMTLPVCCGASFSIINNRQGRLVCAPRPGPVPGYVQDFLAIR